MNPAVVTMTPPNENTFREPALPDFKENKHCIVCGTVPEFRYVIDRFDPPFDILCCPKCGLQMQRFVPVDASHLYSEDYYEGRAEYSYRDERRRRRFDRYVHDARLKTISSFVPPPAEFLDVGAAFGGLVEAATAAGYRARGIDVSAYAADWARSQGIRVEHASLTSGLFADASLDVVTMIEVMEHLEDPRASLRALSRMIRPGGLAVIQTANFEGLQAQESGADYHYYLPGHLYYYSLSNLRRLLADFGFGRIKVFRPVDFGLLPKLLKSRGDFQNLTDYRRWLKTAWYHWKSSIAWGDFSLTSSMVIYAFRDS